MEPDYTQQLRGVIDMTPLEVAELNQLKLSIRAEKCSEKEKKTKFMRLASFLGAGIPHVYWELELDQFGGDKRAERIVLNYIGMLKKAYKQGQGILFMGKHGTGKSMLACIIGKEAIRQGFTVKYIPIASLLDRIMTGFGDKEVKERFATVMTRVEFLIIDDFGKEYRGVGGKLDPLIILELDRILRARINIGKVTIGTTNYDDRVLIKAYGDSIYSIVKGYMQRVEVAGNDHREQQGDTFRKELEENI